MKAAVLFGKNDLRYSDWEEPRVRDGCVKLRVRACGICGSDIPRVLGGAAHTFPCVLGHEMAGEVVETGAGAEAFRPGDRVAVAPLKPCMACDDCLRGHYALCARYSFIGSREQGGFAEYLCAPAANCVPFGASLPYEHGALFEPSTVALRGLFANGFEPGGLVAVLGAGTIGLLLMRWAKLMGAGEVHMFDIDAQRRDAALRLGADKAFLTDDAPGNRYDEVYETAGSAAAMRLAFTLAANRARVCYIGTTHGEVLFPPDMMTLLNRKELTLRGTWMSYSAPFPGREWAMTAAYAVDGRLPLDGLICKEFPLSRCAEAFDQYSVPSRVTGRILLLP